MIQRIQTLFLFLAILLLGSLFFLPLAEFYAPGHDYILFWNRIESGGEVLMWLYALAVLIAIIPVILLVTLFLYKKRRIQLRLCVYAIILSVALSGFFAYHILMMKTEGLLVAYQITLTFPLIAAVLIWLAFVYIRKDDVLVRSLNRLR